MQELRQVSSTALLSVPAARGKPRAHESAKALAPHAELIADPLFAEAPLASPRIPLLRMTVPKWAVVSRILWQLERAKIIALPERHTVVIKKLSTLKRMSG